MLTQAPAGQKGLEEIRATLSDLLGRTDETRVLTLATERTGGGEPTGVWRPSMFATSRNGITRLRALNDARNDLAAEVRANAAAQRDRGNRSPLVYADLVRAEVALGHREIAQSLLQEWRQEVARSPSRLRRISEFNGRVIGVHAQLGDADIELALLRELCAAGYHFGSVITWR